MQFIRKGPDVPERLLQAQEPLKTVADVASVGTAAERAPVLRERTLGRP
jgi:hypothetical protein